VLDKLREYAPNFCPLPELMNLRCASLTRRLFELRKAGYQIDLHDEWVGRERHTSYRLVEPKPFVPADWQLLLHDFLANQWQPELLGII
jgi:hypothetical protein